MIDNTSSYKSAAERREEHEETAKELRRTKKALKVAKDAIQAIYSSDNDHLAMWSKWRLEEIEKALNEN